MKTLKYIFFVAIICSCTTHVVEEKNESTIPETNQIKYAKRFAIFKNQNVTQVFIFGNKNNFKATTIFTLSNDTNGLGQLYRHTQIIKTPVKNAVALASIYSNMMELLGEIESLTAIDNIDYITNPKILKKFEEGKLIELARSPKMDLEKTLRLNPQLIFNFGMGDSKNDVDSRIENFKIPVLTIVDHLEATPIARAEWIKLIAVFFNKEKLADSIFEKSRTNYNTLKTLCAIRHEKPNVLTETKYGDVWYVPGGKSFMAQLINDAGGKYIWNDNVDLGSNAYSFEKVLKEAQNADYWINLSSFNSKEEMYKSEPRYNYLEAFQKGNLYNYNLHQNKLGYSNYWETGFIFPDRILSDLIQILHPELTKQINQPFYYYKKIK